MSTKTAIGNSPPLVLLPLEMLSAASICLKVLAHPIRLRIVNILMQGDFSVGEIAQLCGIKQHQACGHLRLMQNCSLLTSERRGQAVYYRIASRQLPALLGCIRQNCEGENNLSRKDEKPPVRAKSGAGRKPKSGK
jgi:ArsR family transcriptional regulator, zinc-responsive transcriptional repressor